MSTDEDQRGSYENFTLLARIAQVDKSLAVLVERLTDYPVLRQRVENLEKETAPIVAAYHQAQTTGSEISKAIKIAVVTICLSSVGTVALPLVIKHFLG